MCSSNLLLPVYLAGSSTYRNSRHSQIPPWVTVLRWVSGYLVSPRNPSVCLILNSEPLVAACSTMKSLLRTRGKMPHWWLLLCAFRGAKKTQYSFSRYSAPDRMLSTTKTVLALLVKTLKYIHCLWLSSTRAIVSTLDGEIVSLSSKPLPNPFNFNLPFDFTLYTLNVQRR